MTTDDDRREGESLAGKLATFEREVVGLDREARERFGDRTVDAVIALGKVAEVVGLLAYLARHPVRTGRLVLRRLRR